MGLVGDILLLLGVCDADGFGFLGDVAGYPTTPHSHVLSGSNRRLQDYSPASTRVSPLPR